MDGGAGQMMLIMALECVGYFLLVLIIERFDIVNLFSKWCGTTNIEDEPLDLDPDVLSEQDRLKALEGNRDPARTNKYDAETGYGAIGDEEERDIVEIHGLRKVYPGRKCCAKKPPNAAVKDLWYSVKMGEIFGFLGTNGAGKTTTMAMLTGEFPATGGQAYINGYPITDQVNVRRSIGFCPQFNAIFDKLTGREHLELFAAIKGYKPKEAARFIQQMLDSIYLTEYADRLAGTYSGGNKRKLSTAMALIGGPSVVFLDEPSSGMDPISKRFMWNFINSTKENRAVILTTHSMEECAALCQRLAIMVRGQLKCIGTAQHIQSRYGNGYELQMKLSKQDVEAVVERIRVDFGQAELLENYEGQCKIRITAKNVPLADVFETIESYRESFEFKNYSVSQTTLEQIFVNFAREDLEKQNKVGNEL